MIKFQALCICGILSQVYGICHVPGFGFWGVTETGMSTHHYPNKPTTNLNLHPPQWPFGKQEITSHLNISNYTRGLSA
ncbi:hypothetical protein SLEP1_g15025 [Rubroshorea leprosula]|uniref:Secreted protein n=1 Tax=Rubroshorea leprosula TaxID=152421 RepID=A0AAV5IRZ6_9ROSI|nr:hypothetical protein SLEP1_g15025 [Rubroshorea leprosula]